MIVAKTTMKKIPESCDKCHFYSDFLVYCSAANIPNPYNEKGERPDWCPLTEIGRCGECANGILDCDIITCTLDKYNHYKHDFCSQFEPKGGEENAR